MVVAPCRKHLRKGVQQFFLLPVKWSNALVRFEPQNGASDLCRAVFRPGDDGADDFSNRVRHVRSIEEAAYLIGVQVEPTGQEAWARLLASLAY